MAIYRGNKIITIHGLLQDHLNLSGHYNKLKSLRQFNYLIDLN